jgi:long-subunit fatty acid transport protein
VTGNVGLTFAITKHFSISTAYCFPYKTVQKGGLLYLLNDSTETLPVIAIDPYTISKITYHHPGELRLGFCFKPVNIIPTQLFLELVYQDWKNASVKCQLTPTTELVIIPSNLFEEKIPYRSVTKFHLGIEHVFFSGVPFRLGFYHDPNPIDADLDRNWFTAGTGYQFGKLKLDISGAFTNSEYEYPDLFPIAAEERVEFDTVRESVLVGMITLRYNF